MSACLITACNQDPPIPTKVEPAAVDASAPAKADAKTPKQLTEEDKRLLALDPEQVKNLSADKRRQRAYALRRKIMLTPNSPTAKSIRALAEAAKRGEVDLGPAKKKTYPTFTLPGGKPKANATTPSSATPSSATPSSATPSSATPSSPASQ